VDLDVEVGLDHYAIDQQAYQSLTCMKVCTLEARRHVTHEIGKLCADVTARLVVAKSSFCLLDRVRKHHFPTIDLLAPQQQIFHFDRAALVGIYETLRLSIAALDLPHEAFYFRLERLGGRVLFQAGMTRDSGWIGHDRSQIVPHHLVKQVGLQGG
jgi:hypothetical protein